MAQKREGRLTIRNFPLRAGLVTAGQQTTIPEDSLWQAQNITSELDGMLSKRPGTKQWGQALKVPATSLTSIDSFTDFLDGAVGYSNAGSSNAAVVHSTADEGILKTTVAEGASNENYTYSYSISTAPAGSAWSLRFVFSGNNLPAYTADDTTPDTFSFKAIGAAGSGKEFAIWSGGLYYKNNADSKYILISGTSRVGTGAWTVIEIRCNDAAAGTTNVYLDDVLITTTAITSSLLKDMTLTGTSSHEFKWEVEGTAGASPGTAYSTQLITPMYIDTITTPFSAIAIADVTDFHYIIESSSQKTALLCTAGKHIYADNGLLNIWRPLKLFQYTQAYFFNYRNTLVWVDNNGAQLSSTWQWDGYNAAEQLEDASAARIRFGSEHQQRIFAAGDRRNPLRLYYSGDRQPDVWFSPSPDNIEDEFDTALNAGYLPIPSGRGDEITAIWGDFYGLLVVWTKRGAWKLSGYGPTSFRLDRIVGVDTGCENARCVTQIGNDLWFLGRQGIQSLATTDKLGDVETQFPSGPIQNLWGHNPSSVKRISTQYIHRSKMDYNPQQGLLYVAVPLTGSIITDSVFVFNVNAKTWLGPWDLDSTAMANVEISSPRLEVMMHGGATGIVQYTDQSVKADLGTGAYTMTLESSYLNGRSLDTALVGMKKVWKVLRIYVLPRGNWTFSVTCQTDSDNTKAAVTKNQNVNEAHVLGTDWKINANPGGRLRSREEMGYVEYRPDMNGYNFSFKITQDQAGEDLVIQGYEVEFTASGYEVD